MSLPAILLPYQRRWVTDSAQVRVAEKSRRIGLTWASGLEAALGAVPRVGGHNTLYCGYNMHMSRDFIFECAAFCRALHLAASEVEESVFEDDITGKWIHTFRITFASGNRIVSLSSKPNNLRGKKGDIILDEIAFMPDFPEMLKAALALTVWGGRISLISTHSGDTNPFNELINDVRTGKLPYSLHRITLDDALTEGLYERICLVNGTPYSKAAEQEWRAEVFANYPEEEQAAEELLCIPRAGGGSYIARASIERTQAPRPVLRLRVADDFLSRPEIERQIHIDTWLADEVSAYLMALPRHLKHFAGFDFGRSGDLSALVVLCEREDLTYDTPFILELRNVPHEAQRQLLVSVLGRLPHLEKVAVDASGNGSYIAESLGLHFGPRVEPIKFTESWYISHMPVLKDWIENRHLTVPQHADVMRDLQAIELVRGVPKVPADKRQMGSDGLPRHADSAVAMALAVYAARSGAGPAALQLQQAAPFRGHNPNASERARRRRWPGI